MRLTPNEQNAFQTTRQLLRLAGVRVTDASLKTALYHHPDFPSLLAIGDVLKEFQVKSLATRVSPERLIEVPVPALAYLLPNGGTFVTLRNITSDTVEWYHERRGWQTDTFTNFVALWNGVLLLIDPGPKAGEFDYQRQRRLRWVEILRLPIVIGILLACIGIWVDLASLSVSIYQTFYAMLFLKLAGVVVSSLLVWYSLDAENSFLQNICQLGNRTNCNSVLNSSSAKIFGWLSWAEIGLIYFVGGLLSLIAGTTNAIQITSLLLWLNILSLPYSIWSLYYQGRVVKQWCILCLVVQGIFWLEFAIGQVLDWQINTQINTSVFFTALTSFMVISAFWIIMKPHFESSVQINTLIRTVQQLKFNSEYLRVLSSNQRILPPIFLEMKTITLGNLNAVNTLIVVTTPTCTACRYTYRQLTQLLSEGLDEVKCIIILAASLDYQDESNQIARTVLKLPESKMNDALDDWFAIKPKKTDKWIEKYSVEVPEIEGTQQLHQHLRWCELAGVKSTPTLFLNNVELGHQYDIREVPKLLTHLSPVRTNQFI